MTKTAFALPNPLALNLKASPLAPQNWPFSIDCLPETAHLVGGVVRDALLGREPEYLDLDFVVPEGSVEIAQAIARKYKAGFVVLDAERQIARVVFGDSTVDFALQEGDSLEQDLQRRDFTVNAIAYSPHREALVDPVDGYEDILRRRLRMIARENLEDDPLRLLRAYRQAAQLGFEVEQDTDLAIGELSDRIATIAAERIQSELNTLLSIPQGAPWLARAWQAGLLKTWLPDLQHHSLHQVDCLGKLGEILTANSAGLSDGALVGLLKPPASFHKSSLGKESCLPVAKLVALCAAGPEVAESQAQGLKYSRLEMRAAGTVRRLQHFLRSPQMSIRDQFFLFQSAGDLFPVMALVSLAELLQGKDLASLNQSDAAFTLATWLKGTVLLLLIGRYLDHSDPVAHPQPLLTGKSLMKALEIKPGPQIGVLLTELQVAQAEGQVADEAGAIAWLKANQAHLLEK